MLSPADYIAQLEHVVREQMSEIDRQRGQLDQLRTENRRLLDWIVGDGPDALTALQRVYSDPNTPVPDVIKSAIGALPFERSKPPAMNVTGIVDFKEYVRSIRLRQAEKDKARWALEAKAKTIEHESKPIDRDAEPEPTVLGGANDEAPDPAA
jgi:hypothetical protein